MTDELRWWTLKKGDRVTHFEYGAGTVDGSGPLWIYITWDNPDEELHHHTAGVASYLKLMRPPGCGPSNANAPRDGEVV
ncbi:hypothetical protein [Kribbella sp. NBC_00359]|uniref:hypothetical protein n=1 Tax=Kribbella sp. NBC_00359 TaxID=2975966 RepID=UPI002E228550